VRHVLIPRDAPDIMRVASGRAVRSLGGETMGTSWSLRYVAPAALSEATVRAAIERALDLVIAQMSPWVADSEISRFNRAAAGAPCALSAEFCTVLRCALDTARCSGGAYDPTIGALVDLWGFGPPGRRREPPSDESIAAARAAYGWQRLHLDTAMRTLRQPGGVALDLSSIAKGFAVDLVMERLQALGIAHCMVEIGGELRGEGVKPDGSPWWVRLDAPATLPDALVALHGLSVATSGDANRWFEHGGRRWSHTLDPRTGHPVPDGLASVTVLHRRCMQADALATMLLVLGTGTGFALACAQNIAARFVLRRAAGFAEMLTPEFQAMADAAG
jgi:thiamine biosynthesis lipoprotein